MSKLGWLILGLLVLWAHPSHAVSMTLCPDNTHYYPTAEGVSFCPPIVTVTGTTPADTSAVIAGTTNTNTGTVYVSIRLTCTLLQWREVHNGLGDEASGTDATVTDGTFSVSVTGLADTTHYCALVSQYTSAGKVGLVRAIEFTTSTTGGSTGTEITGGDDYFAGTGGSDANSGLTHALRWANYPTTDTLAAGSDMWLYTGSIWTQRPMDITRAGSSGNYNEVGTYYMDGSTPRKIVDGVMGTGTEMTKAEIRGGLTAGCIAARTCTYPTTGFPIDGMTSIYDSPFTVTSTADYTNVQNITVSYTRYGTVHFYGTGSSGSLTNVIFDGVDVLYAGHQAPIVGTDGVQDIVIRNSSAYFTSTCFMFKQSPKVSADVSACGSGGSPYWPVGFIQVTRSSNARVLVEYNEGTRMFGEGIGFYNNSNARSIWRNNRIMNTHSDNYFVDGSGGVVVENNIGVGGNGQMDSVVDTGPGAFGCLHIGSESSTYPNTTGVVFRDNLCVGGGYGLMGNLFGGADTAGDQVGVKVYGNTFIATEGQGTWNQIEVANRTEWDDQNNVRWAESLSAANMCLEVYNSGSYNDNHWYTNPSDSGCDDADDTYGAPGLTESSHAAFVTIDDQNGDSPTWPTFAQANPAGGSAVLGTGTALTSAVLDIANYGVAFTQIREVLDASLTEAEWECALCVDALGATRASPPSKGAVE